MFSDIWIYLESLYSFHCGQLKQSKIVIFSTDVIVFLGLKVFNSDNLDYFSAVEMRNSIFRYPQLKIISF